MKVSKVKGDFEVSVDQTICTLLMQCLTKESKMDCEVSFYLCWVDKVIAGQQFQNQNLSGSEMSF